MRWELYNRLLRRADRYMRWKNFTSIDGKQAHDFAIDALRAEGVELRRLHFDMVDAIRRELGRRGVEGRERVRSERPRQFLDGDRKCFDPEPERDWFDAWSYWLSPRQREVALMLSAGLRKQDVAERIGVTPARVSQIVQDIERIYIALISAREREGSMANDKFFTTQSFPVDPREYDPYKGVRLFSDFIGVGDFTAYTVAGSTGNAPTAAAFTNTYLTTKTSGQDVANIVTLVTVATNNVANAKTEIRDRNDNAVNPAIKFGQAECDFLWRGRYNRNSDDKVWTRVGFYDDVANVASTQDSKNGLFFYSKGHDNWQLAVYSSYTGSAGYKFVKDTGISCNTYRNLGIYVNDKATDAIFTIDGTIVYRTGNGIPNILTQTGATDGVQAGMAMQCTATQTAAHSLIADFMRFRWFVPNRSI